MNQNINTARSSINGSLTERTSDNLITIGIIESNGIDHVSVTLERQQLITSDGVPHFASSVITTSDKLITRLIEGTIRKGQDMSTQNLEQEEVTAFIAFQLFNEFYNKKSTRRSGFNQNTYCILIF